MAQEQNDQQEPADGLPQVVADRARRKLRARRRERDPIWRGLGAMGMVGWSVAVPTLLGTFLGAWLDRIWPTSPVPWTLVLLLAGLATGAVIAWRWVEEERREIGRDRRRDDD
jgi:ATP synthase protein I